MSGTNKKRKHVDDEEMRILHEKRRAKNKAAAARHRVNKKRRIEYLEGKVYALQRENHQLKTDLADAEDENAELQATVEQLQFTKRVLDWKLDDLPNIRPYMEV